MFMLYIPWTWWNWLIFISFFCSSSIAAVAVGVCISKWHHFSLFLASHPTNNASKIKQQIFKSKHHSMLSHWYDVERIRQRNILKTHYSAKTELWYSNNLIGFYAFNAHGIVCDYPRVDWEGLHDHLRDVPWEDVFKLCAAASQFCEWAQVGIDVNIPYHKY